MTYDDLISAIIGRIGVVKFPPVSRQSIEDAERDLGFALPPFFRELYLHIGNGGFGPRRGLLGLNDDGRLEEGWETLVAEYHAIRDRKLPIRHPLPGLNIC